MHSRLMEPKEFFSRLLAKRGLNPNSLAEMLGADGGTAAQSTFQRFKAGKTEQPRQSTMKVVADRLGVNVQAFYDARVAQDEAERLRLTDRHAGGETENSPTYPGQEQLSDLPSIGRIEGALRVLSGASGGHQACTVLPVVNFQGMDMSHKNGSLSGRVDQWLTAPGRFSEFSKITSMPDDSMYPEIHQGEYLALEDVSAVQPEAGDTVLVGDGAGGLWLRKYRPQTRGGFHAVAVNEDHPTLRSEADQVRVLAVMVGHWRGRRAKRH